MRNVRRVVLAAAVLVLPVGASAQPSPVGLWDATVVVPGLDGLRVPFRFEVSGSGVDLRGAFFDGDLRVRSTSGRYENGKLVLQFDQYGSRIDATVTGTLEGVYDRGTRGVPYPFTAVRAVSRPRLAGAVPSIAGEWRIPLDSPTRTGEAAWRLVVRQSGGETSAAIMRIDGDTGTLSGSFQNGRFVLSHFSGARPSVLEISQKPDGTLKLLQDGKVALTAMRVTDARARTAPAPTDPTQHLRVRDPKEKFTFAFPDLEGRVVTDRDPRFAGKVVIVSITGTWCPNCHDEAPFLAELYKTHKAKGLEIVALSFEEPAQLKDLTRVRGFIRQFGITYAFLLAGQPEEAPAKLPQAVNLNTFPATFILGRDGRVRATHAGYAGKATGAYYGLEQKQFLAEVNRLLAEK